MASPEDDDTRILVVRNMGVNAYQNQKAKNESDFLKHGRVCTWLQLRTFTTDTVLGSLPLPLWSREKMISAGTGLFLCPELKDDVLMVQEKKSNNSKWLYVNFVFV